MAGQDYPAADDVTLSALIDNELPEAEAERMRTRLRIDPVLARRFEEMIDVTAEIRGSYDSASEVICLVAELHARAIREACFPTGSPGARLASQRRDRQIPAPIRDVDRAVAGLTSEQRGVLCLAVFEEMNYFEIAETLCVLPRQVMQWLAESRSALRARLCQGKIVALRAESGGER